MNIDFELYRIFYVVANNPLNQHIYFYISDQAYGLSKITYCISKSSPNLPETK